jgi:hypothetical protein
LSPTAYGGLFLRNDALNFGGTNEAKANEARRSRLLAERMRRRGNEDEEKNWYQRHYWPKWKEYGWKNGDEEEEWREEERKL